MKLARQVRLIQALVGVTADGVFGPVTAQAVLDALVEEVEEKTRQLENSEDAIDSRTQKNLKTLEAKAQDIFLPFIRRAKAIALKHGCDYVAISGTRSRSEQNRLYAKGRTKPGRIVTNARFGFSNHNFGIALDFGVFRGGKYLDSDDPERASAVHRAVGVVAKEYGIDWGGDWSGFKDEPHFEVRVPLTMSQKRKRLFNNQSMFG